MMGIDAIKERVIADGIASVTEAYDDYRRAASIEGFEACHELTTSDDFERELQRRAEYERALVGSHELRHVQDYWESRWATIQIEFVYNVMKVAWGYSPLSGRAIVKYVDIVESMGRELGGGNGTRSR